MRISDSGSPAAAIDRIRSAAPPYSACAGTGRSTKVFTARGDAKGARASRTAETAPRTASSASGTGTIPTA